MEAGTAPSGARRSCLLKGGHIMEKYKPEPGYREPYTEYGMEIVMFCAKH